MSAGRPGLTEDDRREWERASEWYDRQVEVGGDERTIIGKLLRTLDRLSASPAPLPDDEEP